jgi:predicted TIM-barrel fold metal-dependent hydrolase
MSTTVSSREALVNIDAHHHLWKYSAAEYGWITPEMGGIRRDFRLTDTAGNVHDGIFA